MSEGTSKPKRFSFAGRRKSFQYAFRGMLYCLKTQHNAWIHALATIVVIAAGFIFSVSPVDWGLLIIVIGLVWIAEMFNTAIERLVDLVSPEHKPAAGKIKDIAAGAVLLAAITAIGIALVVFGRRWVL
ncbi:MAG: diacylglycerol kinase family protein [Bacteroidetes bacterium]|nr:diacylglycerol kinase family protein [Bacteroidota bacterium]